VSSIATRGKQHSWLEETNKCSPDSVGIQELYDTVDQCLFGPCHWIINCCVGERCLHINVRISYVNNYNAVARWRYTDLTSSNHKFPSSWHTAICNVFLKSKSL